MRHEPLPSWLECTVCDKSSMSGQALEIARNCRDMLGGQRDSDETESEEDQWQDPSWVFQCNTRTMLRLRLERRLKCNLAASKANGLTKKFWDTEIAFVPLQNMGHHAREWNRGWVPHHSSCLQPWGLLLGGNSNKIATNVDGKSTCHM